MAPPVIVPSGIVPQTIQRMAAFIRPCRRSGVIAWRRLTCVMLYATPPNPKIARPAMSTGSGNERGASGKRSPANEKTIA